MSNLTSEPSLLPSAWQNCPLAQPEHQEDSQDAAIRHFLDYRPELSDCQKNVWEFPDSDDGNAAFALQFFPKQLAYVPEKKTWMIFFCGRWHRDTTGRLGHYIQMLSRKEILAAQDWKKALAASLADQIANDSDGESNSPKLTSTKVKLAAKTALRRAQNLGNEKCITALLAAASRYGRLIVPSAQWDANPWIIGVQNGILDLRTRLLREDPYGDFVTLRMNLEYRAGAECPQWIKFLNRIIPDKALSDYLQILAGYFLTGHCDDQAFYFLHGDGKNGKSIYVRTLAMLFGEYAGKASSRLIEESRMETDPKAEIAQLPGIRFLYGEETRQGARLREEFVKSLVGGDTLKGEAKYQAPLSFIPTSKLVIMGNHKPRITGTDTGIWRRVRLIPFAETITEEETVAASVLLSQFMAEASGILNWMLDGLARCPSGAITVPTIVAAAVEDYRRSEDELGEFIEECCQDTQPDGKTPKQEVFARYQAWAAENGIRQPLTQKQLTRNLKHRPGWLMNPSKDSWMGKSLSC